MTYDTVSYSEFNKHPEVYLSQITAAKGSLVLKRGRKKPLVIREMDETEYLLSTPANRKHLLEAINEPAKNRKKYKSVDEIRKAFGIN